MARQIIIGTRNFKFNLAQITVEPVLFLYMFTNFLYFPTLQALIFNKVCLQKYISSFCDKIQNNETYKDLHKTENDEITSESSYWILKTTVTLTASSFFVVILFLGPFGDKMGRKIPVLLPCIGALAAYLSGLLNAYYMSASLIYILIGPLLNGLLGGYIACIMSVYSYIGHIASPDSKMVRVGIVEAMVFLAGTVGIFVSGVMLDKQGFVFTFSALCITIGVAILYVVLWLDNLRPSATDAVDDGKCAWLLKFFKDSFKCVTKRREPHVFTSILLQVITLDVLMMCTSGDMDIALLYLKRSFGFSQSLYGYYKGLDNFLRGLVLVTVLPLIRRHTRVKNLPLVMIGLVSYAAGFIILGAASAKWMVFLAAVIGSLKGLPSAGLRATMSSMVSVTEQGRLFGIIAASENVISLLASLLFNELYPASLSFFPGLSYMVAAGLILVVFFVTLYVHMTLPNIDSEPPYETIQEDDVIESPDSPNPQA